MKPAMIQDAATMGYGSFRGDWILVRGGGVRYTGCHFAGRHPL